MANNKNLQIEDEDLSLKEVVGFIKGLFDFFKLQFWKILIVSSIGGGIGFWIAFSSTTIYSAKLKFLIKESGSGTALMSSLGNLSSLIGGAGGNTSPLDRTLAIMGSERIVGSALLKEISLNGNKDLAINHLIDIQGFKKSWKKDSILSSVVFNTKNTSIESFTLSQRKAYKVVLNNLIGVESTLIGKSCDKKSGIFDLSVNSYNEQFSIEFAKLLYNELQLFMYNQSLNASGKNVDILKSKADSIKQELNIVQNELARNTDRTLGLLMQEDKIDQKKLMVKEQLLTVMYGETQKNLETFKFVNESINNGLEIIESPFSPLPPIRKSIGVFTFIGIFISAILTFGFLFIRKWLKEYL